MQSAVLHFMETKGSGLRIFLLGVKNPWFETQCKF